MASGHVNRANRPNTWPHRPMLLRRKSSCQLGAVHTWPLADVFQTRHQCPLWVDGPSWQGLLRRSSIGRCGHVFGLLARLT